MPRLSRLARELEPEMAFLVLDRARALRASGKEVVGLEIGDSPFPTPEAASKAGIAAIEAGRTRYCPSPGLPELRKAAAESVHREFGIPAGPENVVVGSGAKPFEQYFAEAFLEPGDGVLVFSPHFPTYPPNIARRGARAVFEPLRPEDGFRPRAESVARFLATDPRPRAVFLNSPHNPTGAVATPDDLAAIAEVVRGTDLAVFSDEPYCHMAWQGRHASILAEPGMMAHGLAAYTFSKSYSMSGWRVGFAVAAPEVAEAVGQLINTTASCTPPFVQLAALAALESDSSIRDATMAEFGRKVRRLADGLSRIDGVQVSPPAGTFYVFADIRPLCDRFQFSSHGLALYLLEGADENFGVACLGGECFGAAGSGFLRFSCAEPDERIDRALAFLPEAFDRVDRIEAFRATHPEFGVSANDPIGFAAPPTP